MSKKLENKVAIVTGASKGIGASIALHLAAEGAAVVVNYASSRSGADKIVSEIVGKGGRAVAVQADVSKPADVTRLFAEAKAAFGRLDVLVNNAGVYAFGPLEAITPAEYHRQFDLNVLGLILASQEAAKAFGDSGGSIVNVSSAIVSLAPPHSTIYTATKAAADSVTRTLAKELGPKKIRVNAINPGPVVTEGNPLDAAEGPQADFNNKLIAQTPLGRFGRPDDVARAAVFLASPDSEWVTGEILYAAGGLR